MARLGVGTNTGPPLHQRCSAVDLYPDLKYTSIEMTIWNNYVELAENAYNSGFTDLSDRMFKAALGEFHKLQSEDTILSQNVWDLAKIYISQQKYKRAEFLLKAKLETSEQLLGKYNYRITVDIERLATLYAIQGDYYKAERLYRRAMIIARRQFGRNDVRLVHKLRELASLYAVQGKDEKSETALRLARSLETKTVQKFCDQVEGSAKELPRNSTI